MKKILTNILFLTFLLAFVSIPTLTLAQNDEKLGSSIKNQLQPIEDIYGSADEVDESTLPITIAKIIRFVLGFLAIIFLILIIYAGFTWMTSGGNQDKIGKAKKTMGAAIVGAAIVLAAWAITSFILNTLLDSTGTGNNWF